MNVLGVGIDGVDVEDFRRRMSRRSGLAQRLFSPEERAWAALRSDPLPGLAARFAAKEATMKALGVGLGAVDLWDVSVERQPGGRPSLSVSGRAADLAAGQGVGFWLVSLTHTAIHATAVVLAMAEATS
ncbi:MAG: holo-ACP synthase [Acidimicrobiales bacterium]